MNVKHNHETQMYNINETHKCKIKMQNMNAKQTTLENKHETQMQNIIVKT